MKKVAKGCLITLLVLCIGIGVALLVTSLTKGNTETTKETEIRGVKETIAETVVTNVKGITFKVPANWVLVDTKYSQSVLYHNLSDYSKEGVNAISITSSWVEKDFDIKGYVDTFYDALGQSSSIASVKRESYKINGYNIEAVSTVNNGAFGGYCYLMKDNVIVEILYGTENPDDLDKYRNDVNNVIASMQFTGGVKKEDFPEPSEEESSVPEYSGDIPADLDSPTSKAETTESKTEATESKSAATESLVVATESKAEATESSVVATESKAEATESKTETTVSESADSKSGSATE